LHWLSEAIKTEKLTEISVAEKLETFRQQQSHYKGPSFATISGFGPHGALPHYRATVESNSRLQMPGIYLVDSGGQYDDGTTDITRTIALGASSDFEKKIYTTVLKGHLLLGRSLFPHGTNGYQLDVLARQPLWKESLDYNHGTGHGVGAALCVHEGPFSVSTRKNLFPLALGHVLSNEPGCYLVNNFGVRIENLVTVVKKGEHPHFGEFLGFEDLTLCPYDRHLIDKNLLSAEDIAQVDRYHQRVRQELSPFLDDSDKAYLKQQTEAL
jgi:Xaa-Pro aminopeptidase